MTSMNRVVLLVFALCAYSLYAQSATRVSLELGDVTVWLGEDKTTVKQQTEAAGMIFVALEKGDVSIYDRQADNAYSVHFEKDKLAYAARNWLKNESNALPAVMDALALLSDQGATSCKIIHAPISSPETKMNRVFIDCGQRGVVLTYGSVTVNGKGYTDNAITERIGSTQ